MKVVNLREGSIKLYDTIKALPILRYNSLNKFIAQEQGIGNDLDAVSKHLAKFDSFIASGDLASLRQERINLHYNFYLMFNDVDIRTRAFLCFVQSITHEGKTHIVGDLDDDAEVAACIKMLDLTGCTIGDVEEVRGEIKKKWIPS